MPGPSKLDLEYLRLAVTLARNAEAQGNLPIGALIRLDNDIIATGQDQIYYPYPDLVRHAEIEAIRNVPRNLWKYRQDMTLFSTLEPCPMCLGAIGIYQIGRIVFGSVDPHGGASTMLSFLPPIFSKRWSMMHWQGPYFSEECDPLREIAYAKLLTHSMSGQEVKSHEKDRAFVDEFMVIQEMVTPMGGKKVLLVEAHGDELQHIFSTLKMNGPEIVLVKSIELSKIQPDEFQLVVWNFEKGDEAGIEQVKNILKVPVIVIANRFVLHHLKKWLHIGIDDCVVRPFKEEELQTRINYLLKRRYATDKIDIQDVTIDHETQLPAAFDRKWIEQLQEVVGRELKNDLLSVPLLARRMHLSERQFLRRLKAMTGLSPVQYLTEVFLMESYRLLTEGEVESVTGACRAVHFKDEKYFKQLFRKRFGNYPADLL